MIRKILLVLSFILIAVGFGPLVFAQDEGPINAQNIYAFATPDTAKTGAVFMIIQNKGGADDTLTSARTDVADIVELHENSINNDNGRMMMRKIDKITVPANGMEVLEPKGKHIMLIGMKQGLKEGTNFALSLTFTNAGVISVPVKVVPAGETAMDTPDQHEGHGDHHQGHGAH